ncbi:MAG: hypothetical protein K0Q72_2422, partial [Armatimonadetes bacterium]|nr:hypothetical protein [Armatimonadota bacterium]
LTETGKALAFHIRDDGKEMAQRVTTVAQIVKRRVATTRQIISEIKPRSAETAEAVRDAASSVRETSADLGNRARTVGDLAQRLSRVKTAAQAAVRAGATKPSGTFQGRITGWGGPRRLTGAAAIRAKFPFIPLSHPLPSRNPV